MAGRKKALFETSSNKPFELSRSKLDMFMDCPCCFYLDRRMGISRPPSLPFTLNTAVDTLLKKEFDQYRASGRPHPLMARFHIDAVPFQHKELETWRNNFKGIRHHDKASNIILYGALDDVWVKPDRSLLVADYKATSTSEEITLDSGYKDVFKRQLEVYQWLLRQNGFTVGKDAYLVYANATKDRASFDGRLEFEMTILTHQGRDSWIAKALLDVRACLSSAKPPPAASGCAFCGYRHCGV